jgi:hypothetical protein
MRYFCDDEFYGEPQQSGIDFVTLGSITVEQRARNSAAGFVVVVWAVTIGEGACNNLLSIQ